MMKFRHHCIPVFVFILLSVLSPKQPRAQENKELTILNFTSRNGLPQNSVVDMIMDSGYLWMCTEVGLVRFDGNRFKAFNPADKLNRTAEHFKQIISTSNGEKYALSAEGYIMQIKANEACQLRGNYVTPGTNLYINGGLMSIDMYQKIIIPRYHAIQLRYGVNPVFIPLPSKGFLAAREKEITWFINTKKNKTIHLNGPKIENLFLFENEPYFTDDQNRLFQINPANQKIIPLQFSGDLKNSNHSETKIRVFWRHGIETPVLKKNNRIYLLKGKDSEGNLQTELFSEECPENTLITSAIFDNNSKQLFLGTDTKGLFVYKRKIIHSYIFEENGSATNNAYYAMVSPDSNIIISSYGRVFSINGPIKPEIGIRNFNRECLIINQNHQLLYVSGDSIMSYDLKTKQSKLVYATHGNSNTTFYKSGDTIFTGNAVEIGYLLNNIYHRICLLDKNIIEKPENIIRGPDGDLWFSSCKGVFKITEFPGNPKVSQLLKNVCARYLFKTGNLVMIATYGSGYFIWNKGVIYKMPPDENDYLSFSHSFLIDKNNFLWISSNHGLFKTSMTAVNNFLKDTTSQIFYKYFGENDGLRSVEFNGGCFPNSLVLKNGFFAFPTMDGIALFDPLKTDNSNKYSQIYIDEIKVDGISISPVNTFQVDPNTENLVFNLTSPQEAGNQNLILEYFLEGYNKNWAKLPSGHFTISFSNLPYGEYQLKLRSRMGYLPVSYLNPTISFTVGKKYYQTFWFLSTLILLLGFIIWQAIAQYLKNLRRTNINLERLIHSRTVELKQSNEQLEINNKKLTASEKSLKQNVEVKNKLISIISHDIIAPLHFISMVARNALIKKDQPLQDIITEIKDSTEKLYFNAQNILNWIKNQNQKIEVKPTHVAVNPLVEELLEMNREFAMSKGNNLENAVDYDDIIKTDKNILSVILNNLISNANKYCSKSDITISADTINGHYQICIADNGPGIAPEILDRLKTKMTDSHTDFSDNNSNQSGLGYIIIYEMIQLIQAKIEIESAIEKGTCVRIVF